MDLKAPFLRQAMSRGRVWVDDNQLGLAAELQKRNFRVDTVPKHLHDYQIKRILADQRFITNNSKDFDSDDDITSFEYCLIATENVTQDPCNLAKIISEAWLSLELRHRHTCKVTLMKDGKHTVYYPPELNIKL